MIPRLRLFTADDSLSSSATPMISVRLEDILEPLVSAARTKRAFLRDFAIEDVQIPADLYDALIAYRRLRAAG